MKQLTALLLCAILALAPALAEGGTILDGRWLNADIQGNVTEDTPAELKDDYGLFVNKDWILQAQIPAGESKTGSMEDVDRTLKAFTEVRAKLDAGYYDGDEGDIVDMAIK